MARAFGLCVFPAETILKSLSAHFSQTSLYDALYTTALEEHTCVL